MDNCPSHKTRLMKHFAECQKVFLIYNGIYSSKINPVEYIFEIIKRNFRCRIEKDYRENISRTLHKNILNITHEQLRSCLHRALEAMVDCINMKDMWTWKSNFIRVWLICMISYEMSCFDIEGKSLLLIDIKVTISWMLIKHGIWYVNVHILCPMISSRYRILVIDM